MDIDGIWRVELMGVHGWEAVSTSYLESGRYLAGGAHGYAVGRYEVDAKNVVIRATLTLYGNGLTLFGKASGQIEVTYEGELLGDQLVGTATDAEYRMHFRSTRVGSIPATAH